MKNSALQKQQLSAKMQAFMEPVRQAQPPTGWIRAVRMALGISLEQLGNKLGISRQSMRHMELREREGSVTLKSLREAADSLDMHLVYGFVPKDGTLKALIERKARELATEIVLRTSHTMRLEDQENSEERIQKAIEEKTAQFVNELPKMLWD